jgi:hypothetical protein
MSGALGPDISLYSMERVRLATSGNGTSAYQRVPEAARRSDDHFADTKGVAASRDVMSHARRDCVMFLMLFPFSAKIIETQM